MIETLEILGRSVSAISQPYVIAEAGVHHYNSLEHAKAYILQAKIAGADAIKFQTYKAEKIATTWAPTYWDDPSGKGQFEIFAGRSKLTEDQYRELFAYSAELGITFLSTPFDLDSADLLNRCGMAAYKIASADMLFFPMLERIASFKKPMILSTGAAELEEIRETAAFLKKLGAHFAFLHCVLSYPTPVKDANLARIAVLQKEFPDVMIGYSDHTQPQDSPLACPIAVAMGARIVEKHFTLNKRLDGDDHYHAVDPEGLAQLVRDCKDAHRMTVAAEIVRKTEIPARTYARRSIVARANLSRGTVLNESHIDFKRPGTGIPPNRAALVLGKKLTRDHVADELITPESVS